MLIVIWKIQLSMSTKSLSRSVLAVFVYLHSAWKMQWLGERIGSIDGSFPDERWLWKTFRWRGFKSKRFTFGESHFQWRSWICLKKCHSKLNKIGHRSTILITSLTLIVAFVSLPQLLDGYSAICRFHNSRKVKVQNRTLLFPLVSTACTLGEYIYLVQYVCIPFIAENVEQCIFIVQSMIDFEQ